ncbi:MAG: DedA family protein [Mycobacteriales bacterium]
MSLAVNFLDPKSVIETFGTVGIFVILFAETGLLIGFFLPGDSLLFTAGLFASTAAQATVHLSLPVLVVGCPVSAILGAQVGYLIGRRAGPVLFDRADNKPFKREYVDRAELYFDRYGAGKAVVLARFVPIIRTFMNPMAGVLEMPARTFTLWNVVGGLVWTELVLALGYTLGKSVKGIDKYLLPIIAVIIVVSLLPVVREIRRSRRIQ